MSSTAIIEYSGMFRGSTINCIIPSISHNLTATVHRKIMNSTSSWVSLLLQYFALKNIAVTPVNENIIPPRKLPPLKLLSGAQTILVLTAVIVYSGMFRGSGVKFIISFISHSLTSNGSSQAYVLNIRLGISPLVILCNEECCGDAGQGKDYPAKETAAVKAALGCADNIGVDSWC